MHTTNYSSQNGFKTLAGVQRLLYILIIIITLTPLLPQNSHTTYDKYCSVHIALICHNYIAKHTSKSTFKPHVCYYDVFNVECFSPACAVFVCCDSLSFLSWRPRARVNSWNSLRTSAKNSEWILAKSSCRRFCFNNHQNTFNSSDPTVLHYRNLQMCC